MMRLRLFGTLFAVAFAFVAGVGGCGNDGSTEPEGPLDFVEIYVTNETGQDLLVKMEPTMQEFLIKDGRRVQFMKKAPTDSYIPNPGWEYSCLSVRSSDRRVLLYQQVPVDNSAWLRYGTAYAVDYYDLILEAEDLVSGGVQDECTESI